MTLSAIQASISGLFSSSMMKSMSNLDNNESGRPIFFAAEVYQS